MKTFLFEFVLNLHIVLLESTISLEWQYLFNESFNKRYVYDVKSLDNISGTRFL